jgi:hypothetical protein
MNYDETGIELIRFGGGSEMSLAKLAQELGDEAAIKIAVEQLGMLPQQARFILANERGVIDGDILTLDADDMPLDSTADDQFNES